MESDAKRKLREEHERVLQRIRAKIEEGKRLHDLLLQPDLSETDRELIRSQLVQCELTEREKPILAKFVEDEDRRKIRETLRRIPVEVVEEAIERSRVASSEHKSRVLCEKIGLPVTFGKKKDGRTFDLYRLLDWLFGEFIPGRTVGMDSKDETLQMTAMVADPMVRERLQHEYVRAKTEEVRIKISKTRGELVPVAVLSALMQSQGDILNRIGERLKAEGLDDLLEEFNDFLQQFGEAVEKIAKEINHSDSTYENYSRFSTKNQSNAGRQ